MWLSSGLRLGLKWHFKTLIVEMGGVYAFVVTSVDHFGGIN